MSEVTIEEGEKTQADNFAALREKYEAAVAELRPLKARDAVSAAGFNPNSPEGKALHRLALAETDVDAEKVKALADELGFEVTPPKPELTPTEQAAVAGAQKQAALNTVTTSDEPADIASQIADLDQQIMKARAEGLPTQQMMSQRISLATRAAVSAGPRV
jgi:hypothetical protein